MKVLDVTPRRLVKVTITVTAPEQEADDGASNSFLLDKGTFMPWETCDKLRDMLLAAIKKEEEAE